MISVGIIANLSMHLRTARAENQDLQFRLSAVEVVDVDEDTRVQTISAALAAHLGLPRAGNDRQFTVHDGAAGQHTGSGPTCTCCPGRAFSLRTCWT